MPNVKSDGILLTKSSMPVFKDKNRGDFSKYTERKNERFRAQKTRPTI